MSYCDDCILLDICGKEGCCDEAMTFCADKNKFIYVSTLDKIRAEIRQIVVEEQEHDERWARGLRYSLCIIDKYKAESEGKYDL